ncbi:MAG: hypothetical protein AAF533_15790 [Acidobacteriota bacterium]
MSHVTSRSALSLLASLVLGLALASDAQAQTGACCTGATACADGVDEFTCTFVMGGVFMGPGSTCATVSCPFGACCAGSDCFPDTDLNLCFTQSGTYQGDGTTCAPNPCGAPPALEACCLGDGTCVDTAPVECDMLGGTLQGDGSTCVTADCPPPPEACCMPDFSCQMLTPDDCTLAGGMPQGMGTTCMTADCGPTPIPTMAEWMRGLLAVLLATAGVVMVLRTRG